MYVVRAVGGEEIQAAAGVEVREAAAEVVEAEVVDEEHGLRLAKHRCGK